MKLLVDTNILVRLVDSDSPYCSVCKQSLEDLIGQGCLLLGCTQVMIEFWAVATRPKSANGLGLTPAEAEAALLDAEQMLTFLDEPHDLARRWRTLVNTHGVCGKQAHDTRLVAWMEGHGLSNLLTFNVADFSRFNQIICLSPGAVIPPLPSLPARSEPPT